MSAGQGTDQGIRAAVAAGAAPPRNGAGAIRARNVARLLAAATAVFAEKGFAGATTGEIAARAGLPKANLHYYFPTKGELYARVLDGVLGAWLDVLDEIRPEAEPAEALAQYIARKLAYSRDHPERSRLWASELLGGARHVRPVLRARLRRYVAEKSAIIEGWIAAGKMDRVDPAHLLFVLWATTQTYADFAAQITTVLGKRRVDDAVVAGATATVTALVLKGLGIRS